MSTPCRETCARVGEPLAGSCGPLHLWIGISWPKPRWNAQDLLRSEGLPDQLAELVARHGSAKVRLAVRLFQRASRPATNSVEVVLWRAGSGGGRIEGVPLERLGALLESFIAGAQLGLEPLSRELFVCTDGRHDACCARFGHPVFEALRAAADRGGPAVRVAESSHLGGHRFAANCLSLPDGHMYGRLSAEDAPGLLQAVRQGIPYGPRLRGSLAGESLEAVATAFLEQQSAGGADGWRLAGPPEHDDRGIRIPVRRCDAGGERHAFVRCIARIYHAPTSCGEQPCDTTRWIAAALEG